MAVYRSGTMPVIEEESRRDLASILLVDHARIYKRGTGVKAHDRACRSWFKIPRKASLEIIKHESGPHMGNYEFIYRWYKVTTNA